MNVDKFGQLVYSETDICNIYLTNPDIKLTNITVSEDMKISDIIDTTSIPNFIKHRGTNLSIEEFDNDLQNRWFIPESYHNFDIAKYVLDLCKSEEELQRVGQELLMYQDRDMFPLLCYLKYLVDTMRENNIVWGVGRGSSVSSFVLFLLGVHRINSLYYDLSIDEFLK